MNHLIEGIGIGIGLSLITGPLLFTLIQTSLDRGARAGFSVALGIWASDIAIILFSLMSLDMINKAMGNALFFRGLGLLGGTILLATGLSFILSNAVKNIRKKRVINKKNLLGYFVVGILINGVNPFTIVFWLGLLTTYVGSSFGENDVYYLLAGIMGTIIVTDALKVILAKRISKRLKRRLIIKLRRVAGIILVVFGIILFIRVLI